MPAMRSTGWLGARGTGCPWGVLAAVAHMVAVHAQPQEDTAPPQISCLTSPIRLPSTTMELTAELALSDVFEQFTDDDDAHDAEMAVTVSSIATGGELDSLTIAPNAGAASGVVNRGELDTLSHLIRREQQLKQGGEGAGLEQRLRASAAGSSALQSPEPPTNGKAPAAR